MIDSGLTLHYIYRSLSCAGPLAGGLHPLRPAPSAARGPGRQYRGFEVPDDFFVGYGFDYHQLYRNLPYVAYLNSGRARPALF